MYPIKYYDIIQKNKDKKFIRYQMVSHAREYGIKPTDRAFHTNVKTVRKWLSRWKPGTIENDSKSYIVLNLTTLTIVLLVLCFCNSKIYGIEHSGQYNNIPSQGAPHKVLARVVAVSDAFRQSAALDVTEGLRAYASLSCREKWNKTYNPLFEGDEWQMRHFFGLSLIIPGTIDSMNNNAIMAYYNPWLDVALLCNWQVRVYDEKLTDFIFLTGEALRSEKLPENSACPGWLIHGKGSFEKAIADKCTLTIKLFQEKFPLLKGKHSSSFIELDKDIEGSENNKFDIIKARMIFREAYKGETIKADIAPVIERELNNVKLLIVAGELDELLNALSKDQNRYVAETVVMLPAQIRESLFPHWYVRGKERILIFLSSPLAPRFFVSVKLDLDAKQYLQTVYIYDFNSASQTATKQSTLLEKER